MSESIQTQGKTVNDAVSEALLQLGLRRDEVEIKVIEEPKSGLLGFIGTRPAKVLVRKKPEGRGGRGRDRSSSDNAAHSLSDGRNRGTQRRGPRSERAGKDNEGRESGRGSRGGRGRGGRGDQGRKPAGNETSAEARGRSQGESSPEPRVEPRKDSRNEARESSRDEGRSGARNENRSGGRGRVIACRRYRKPRKAN